MRQTLLIGLVLVLVATFAVASYAAISPTLTDKLAAVLSDPEVPQSQKDYNQAVCDELKRIWAQLDSVPAEPCIPPPSPPPPSPPPPPSATPGCTRALAAGAGSLGSFVSGLRAGETGCLSGSFSEDLSIGNSGFTLRSADGQRALLRGRVSIRSAATDVTLDSLDLNGAALASFSQLYVNGDRITLRNLDINGGGVVNCILAGAGGASAPAEWANDLVIEKSRVHHCGNDSHEHAIYAEFTDRLVVRDSFFYASGGYGLHFYPEANNSLVEYSAIVANDTGTGSAANVTFSGEDTGGEYDAPHASNGNRIVNSLITFTSPGVNGTNNIVSYYPAGSAAPSGNEVAFSCVYSPGDTNFGSWDGPVGYTQHDNLIADPLFVDAANSDYHLRIGSPCAGRGPR